MKAQCLWMHIQYFGNATNGEKSLIVFCHHVSTEFDALYSLEHYAGLGQVVQLGTRLGYIFTRGKAFHEVAAVHLGL